MDVQQLARIIVNEAGPSFEFCGWMAMLAVAYVTHRNGNWATPRGEATPDALWMETHWWEYPDPSKGARYLMSAQDMQRLDVQRFTSDRAPPTVVFLCKGGLSLYAFTGNTAGVHPGFPIDWALFHKSDYLCSKSANCSRSSIR